MFNFPQTFNHKPHAEKWFETRSLEELHEVLAIFEGLMNIAFASKKTQSSIFITRLTRYAYDMERSNAVLDRNYSRDLSRMDSKLKYILQDQEGLHARYFEWKQSLATYLQSIDHKLSMKKRTTLQRTINVEQYRLYDDFRFSFALSLPDANNLFDMKYLVMDFCHHLMLIHTLENGFESIRLDKIAKEQVFTQPIAFFEGSFPLDFFAHDPTYLRSHPAVKYWVCYKKYLSTKLFETMEEAKRHMEDGVHFVVAL
ncbi:hypothetical protein [Vibrio sp. Hal054]|uniref:hypothetical protein n=1 Tax=Vibrio sp. Hal054 TaxID=3035158 RepID=UPI00301CAEB8